MSITISKTGKKPAQIAVKQGDEKWEGTEEQLDKMPAKFRPHVDRMLGRLPMAIGIGGFGPAGGMGGFNVRVLPPQPGETMPQGHGRARHARAVGSTHRKAARSR